MAYGWVDRNREQSMKKPDMDSPGHGGIKDRHSDPFLQRSDGSVGVLLQCEGESCIGSVFEVTVLDEHKRPDPVEMERIILDHAANNPKDEHGHGSPYLCPHGCKAPIHLYRKPIPKSHDTETI